MCNKCSHYLNGFLPIGCKNQSFYVLEQGYQEGYRHFLTEGGGGGGLNGIEADMLKGKGAQ